MRLNKEIKKERFPEFRAFATDFKKKRKLNSFHLQALQYKIDFKRLILDPVDGLMPFDSTYILSDYTHFASILALCSKSSMHVDFRADEAELGQTVAGKAFKAYHDTLGRFWHDFHRRADSRKWPIAEAAEHFNLHYLPTRNALTTFLLCHLDWFSQYRRKTTFMCRLKWEGLCSVGVEG
jgi:hypothetical protein